MSGAKRLVAEAWLDLTWLNLAWRDWCVFFWACRADQAVFGRRATGFSFLAVAALMVGGVVLVRNGLFLCGDSLFFFWLWFLPFLVGACMGAPWVGLWPLSGAGSGETERRLLFRG